jgi:low affinity Fe/Cu permease
MGNQAQGRAPSLFSRVASATARWTGRSSTFALAALAVVGWLVTGPIFHYSDTWQLVINTATTIITFLMVFLIQATQNRDTEAIQIKLDELIRATEGAQNRLLDLEQLDERELDEIRKEYLDLAESARRLADKAAETAADKVARKKKTRR